MNEELYTLEEITTQLATWLMDDKGMSIHEALSFVYNSTLYAKIQDVSNGLMAQSDAYLYDMLVNEINTSN